MASSGGGSSKPPNDANPAGTTTGYGSSTPFSPSYNSVLSNGMGWADTGEVDAANANNATAAAQPTAASSGGGYDQASLRAMLAQMMQQQQPNTPQQQLAMRLAAMPGGQGSYAGMGGGDSYTGSSAMRR